MFAGLETFRLVVELGSFSAAAKVMRRSPSSVARQITGLEDELNAELLTRTTHHLALTPFGERVLVRSERALAELETIRAMSRPSGPEPSGILRISCFQSLGRKVVAPLLAEFLERYPRVQAELDLSNQVSDLAKGGLDLAIRIGAPHSSSLRMRRLLKHDAVLCAAPRYLQRVSVPQHPTDLADHNCLSPDRGRANVHWHFTQAKSSIDVKARGNLKSRGGEPLVQAALAGLGVLLISRWSVADELADGTLVELLPNWQAQLSPRGAPEVFVLYKPGRGLSPAGRAFLDELTRACHHLAQSNGPSRQGRGA